MKRGINLRLPKPKPSQVSRKGFNFSLVFLLIVFVVGVSLVGYNLYLNAQLQSLSDERESLRNQILSQNTKVYKYQDAHKRLKNIQAIVSGRLKVIDKIDTLASVLQDETEVLSVSTEALTLDYSVSSSDLSKINSLLEEKLLALASEKKENVKSVELSSLFFNKEDGDYTLNFKVVF